MLTFDDRAAARFAPGVAHLALVPASAAPGYAAAMASVPRVRLVLRQVTRNRELPAVGSFG